MPASNYLSVKQQSKSNSDKKLTRNHIGSSIPAPQRKRPALHSTTGKENTVLSTTNRLSSTRRSSKSNRLSDRWPVLNRIIRTSKSEAGPRDQQARRTGETSNETEDEDGAVAAGDTSLRSKHCSPRYRQRVSHPTSPKFPSPLSGVKPVKRFLLVRHNYPHRGYSQSALYHQRGLWNKRKGEWDDYECMLYQAGVTLEQAYGGIIEDNADCLLSLPPHLKSGPWTKRSCPTFEMSLDPKKWTPLVNPATFPRLGNLSMARDPFLISIDTWFADFPLWTLSKLVWIYDVNHRCGAIACRRKGANNNYKYDPNDSSTSSADMLWDSSKDLSDVTLVSTVRLGLHPLSDTMKDGTIFGEQLRCILSSSSSLNSISPYSETRPWETCWFSRWELLYNQIRLAGDIIVTSDDYSSLASRSKKVARVVLTAPGILYDPHCNDNDEQEVHVSRQTSEERNIAEAHGVIPAEEEDEDYGNVISPSESRYRLGAHVDPLSMFATAAAELFDPMLTSGDGVADPEAEVPDCTRDYASDIAGGLRQLTLTASHIV